METERFELLTPCLQGRCSPNRATPPLSKIFTFSLILCFIAKQMGLSGLEPPTSRLSGVRSNRLSYKPPCHFFLYLFISPAACICLCSTYFFKKGSGSHLLSHAVSSIVPSAAYGLTFVFGMGTGVPPKRIVTRSLDDSTVK